MKSTHMFREFHVLLTDADFTRSAFYEDHSLQEAAQTGEVRPSGEVCPFLLQLTFPAALGCASCSRSSSATRTFPYLAATWRGVNPF